jgi:hypothetical protein
MAQAITEKSRVSWPLALMLSAAISLAVAGATATATAYSWRDGVVAQVRSERKEDLNRYVTREELLRELDSRFERLYEKLERMRSK